MALTPCAVVGRTRRGRAAARLAGLLVALTCLPGCERPQTEPLGAYSRIEFGGFARQSDPEWRITEETLGPALAGRTDRPRSATVTGTFAEESQIAAAREQVARLLDLSSAWYEQPENTEVRERHGARTARRC